MPVGASEVCLPEQRAIVHALWHVLCMISVKLGLRPATVRLKSNTTHCIMIYKHCKKQAGWNDDLKCCALCFSLFDQALVTMRVARECLPPLDCPLNCCCSWSCAS
eukprot:3156951-Amphidinium_carterae.1